MIAIQLIACIGMIAGVFLLLDLSFSSFTYHLFSRLSKAPGSIRGAVNEATQRKKPGFLRKEILECEAILEATGRSHHFPLLCAVSMALFLFGACAAILFRNAFLVPVLAVGLMLVPFWYIKMTASHFKKDSASELETAMSVITTAYLRTENFPMAVQENLSYLNPPVDRIFEQYLFQINHVNPDMSAALDMLKFSVNNGVWQEWCDAVAACQIDRSLKTTLQPIVSKLSDIRIVNGELANLMMAPRKEFLTMASLVLLNIPLVRFINQDWYHTLTDTIPGQFVIAVCVAAVFVSFAFVVKLTQPMEYRR